MCKSRSTVGQGFFAGDDLEPPFPGRQRSRPLCYLSRVPVPRRLGVLAPVLAALALLLAAGCKKPTPDECREICWKFNELAFWDAFEVEAAELSPEEKAEARAEREEVWAEIKDRAFDSGLNNCIVNCRDQGKQSQVPCVRAAETAAAARACFED
jgi:hypothetical protein